MEIFELTAPCHFGLEAVLKKEIMALGYDIVKVEDGKVIFRGGIDAICRANIFLRTAERILINIGRFHAVTFDELFEKTKALNWHEYIPYNGRFWVTKATSVKSKLFSPSDIQSIMKKAMVECMKLKYNVNQFPEEGEDYPIRVTIMKDEVSIGLDTSGASLHKRGYRLSTVKAPITETLAAALIMLTPWKHDRILVDPFCGSGTFPIEAALIGANIAPGMNRSFISENWTHIIPKKEWYNAINEAEDMIIHDISMDIQGYDINGNAVKAAMENAKNAEVDKFIHFQQRPVSKLSHRKKYGFIITNPPYGMRLDASSDSQYDAPSDLPNLYREIGEAYQNLDSWSMFLITAYEQAEKYIGRKADKNRKIYNGMIKSYFYQYMGAKPPHRPKNSISTNKNKQA